MVNDHFDCYCYDCLESQTINSVDSNIGKFVTSDKPVNIYKSMGGALRRVVKPNGFMGTVEGYNSKGNWIKLSNGGGYIVVNKDLYYTAPKSIPELTPDQKFDIMISAGKAGLEATGNRPAALGLAVTDTSLKVVKGVEDAAKTGLDILSFTGTYFKWIMIAVVILVVFYYYKKLS